MLNGRVSCPQCRLIFPTDVSNGLWRCIDPPSNFSITAITCFPSATVSPRLALSSRPSGGRSSRRRQTALHRQPRFAPASESKPRVHPWSDIKTRKYRSGPRTPKLAAVPWRSDDPCGAHHAQVPLRRRKTRRGTISSCCAHHAQCP
jgi:hypothetical protein